MGSSVRFGLIGCGGAMGRFHESYLSSLNGLTYTGCADYNTAAAEESAQKYGCKMFGSAEELIDSGEVDLVLIASPHYTHPVLAERAFKQGVHVITEKPLAVTAKDGQSAIDTYNAAKQGRTGLVFAGMFQQRTLPEWKTVKRLCENGSIGEVIRTSWTITDWFRTQTYYDAGGWRATWKGEGGGVLLNQCPHNLDLLCWFVGQPSHVTALAEIGKHHHIEVEDDVTAILKWPNGAAGTFITSTGQSPGINRLEIVGDTGTVVAEKKPGATSHTVTYYKAEQPVSEFTKTSPERFSEVAFDACEVTPLNRPGCSNHQLVLQNVVDAIRSGEGQAGLISPAPEGLLGLELGNAMLLSGLDGVPINLPMPAEGAHSRRAYSQRIQDLAENSTFVRREVKASQADMSASF